jgi:hypothetical protein
LSYSVVTTFITVCGSARADTCQDLTKTTPCEGMTAADRNQYH